MTESRRGGQSEPRSPQELAEGLPNRDEMLQYCAPAHQPGLARWRRGEQRRGRRRGVAASQGESRDSGV